MQLATWTLRCRTRDQVRLIYLNCVIHVDWMLVYSPHLVDACLVIEGQNFSNQGQDCPQKFCILFIGQTLCELIAGFLHDQRVVPVIHDIPVFIHQLECTLYFFYIPCLHNIFKQLKCMICKKYAASCVDRRKTPATSQLQ